MLTIMLTFSPVLLGCDGRCDPQNDPQMIDADDMLTLSPVHLSLEGHFECLQETG